MTQHIGYKRVSTVGQNTQRQLDEIELAANGLVLDRVFIDKKSGKDKARPQLDAMIAHLRAGDTVHVHSIDRLARNMADLLDLVKQITSIGAGLKFHKECLEFAGEASPMQNLQLQMMGAFAEFERSLITERAAEGRAIAKAKGVKFGRKPTLSKKETKALLAEVATGKKISNVAIDFDVSRAMVYRLIAANEKHQALAANAN